MNYTPIEQSKKLVELGLDLETADMFYFLEPTPAGNIYHLTIKRTDIGVKSIPDYNSGDIPCWSTGALLDILYKVPNSNINIYYHPETKQYWIDIIIDIEPLNLIRRSIFDIIGHETGMYDSLVDACVDMVKWMIENQFIKK